jgi:tetrahydromethanopterin S-methyltransferase subunit A
MERKSKKEFSHFVLSSEDKVALIEAKMKRVEAQMKALAELAKAKDSARGSKYPSH